MTKYANPTASNSDYQKTFARNLVQSLGFADAVSICQENCWDGTLRCILSAKKMA